MCGLFGVMSRGTTKHEREMFELLSILSCTRGLDSSGIARLGPGKKGKIRLTLAKDVVATPELLRRNPYFIDEPAQILMGHARYATLGRKTRTNAQPIEEGSVVVAHNGTIGHFVRAGANLDVESDSRELARRIHTRGIEAAVREAGRGAYAISYIDFKNRTLNFIRDDQRTLYFLRTRAKDTIYWASEPWMLERLDERTGVQMENMYSIQPGQLYTFDFGTTKPKVTQVIKEEEKSASVTVIHSGDACCRWCRKPEEECECVDPFDIAFKHQKKREAMLPSGQSPHVLALPQPKKDTSVPTVGHIFGKRAGLPDGKKAMYRGYAGKTWAISGLLIAQLKQGCSVCKHECKVTDTVHWMNGKDFICDDCMENDPTVDVYVVKSGGTTYKSEIVRLN